MQKQSQAIEVWVVQEINVHGSGRIIEVCGSEKKAKRMVEARKEQKQQVMKDYGTMAAFEILPYSYHRHKVV